MSAKRISMGTLLILISISGPLVAYAGVTVILPSNQETFEVDASPPVTFDADLDYPSAKTAGFVSAFTGDHNNASFSFTLHGLSGANLTIDKLVNVSTVPGVASYKVEVSQALTGTLTNPDLIKIRLWDHAVAPLVAPSGDLQDNVCAVLDLEAAVDTESTGACTASTIHIQLVLILPEGSLASGSSSVKIRPSSITFT